MSKFINASIPLAHETLSREEVAERLVKAAKIGGYEMDTDPMFGSLKPNKTHFITKNNNTGSGFYNHPGKPNRQRLTLEQFEQHCQELAEPKTPPIDQMRFDAAKAAMQVFLLDTRGWRGYSFDEIAKWSVEIADRLIAELKNQNA